MQQRVSLITLGARDIAALAAFYEALGLDPRRDPDGVIAFDLIGQTLGSVSAGETGRRYRIDCR